MIDLGVIELPVVPDHFSFSYSSSVFRTVLPILACDGAERLGQTARSTQAESPTVPWQAVGFGSQVGEGRHSRKEKAVCKTPGPHVHEGAGLGGPAVSSKSWEVMEGGRGKGGRGCVTQTWGHVSGQFVTSMVGFTLMQGACCDTEAVLLQELCCPAGCSGSEGRPPWLHHCGG